MDRIAQANQLQWQLEKDRTRDAVGQITSWCIIIAAHQRFGIGAGRMDKLSRVMAQLQERYETQLNCGGKNEARKWLMGQLPKGCRTDFAVPVNRRAKNSREELLRTVANEAAGCAWCLFAVALGKALGFGKDRLETLRKEAIANYRQFNEWAREDKEWAYRRLQQCAQAALQEEMELVDKSEEETRRETEELDEQARRAIKLATMAHLGRKQRPAGWAVLNTSGVIERMQASGPSSVRPVTRLGG